MISSGQVANTLRPVRRPERAPGDRATAWRGRLAKENQMPLFGSGSGDSATTWEPQAADSRLAHTAGRRGGTACSPPTCRCRSTCCWARRASSRSASWSARRSTTSASRSAAGRRTPELQVLTQAMYSARELAMSRMRAEADHLGADGIVGCQLRMQMYAWGQDVLEFVATGTAVRRWRRRGARTGPPTAGRSPRTCPRRTSSGCWPRGPCRSRSCWHLRLPHRAPVGHAGAAPGRPEPGDGPVHPGRVRGPRAGPGPDAGRGDRRPARPASSG